MQLLDEGLPYADDWQIKTHFETLLLMEAHKDNIPGLEDLLEQLKDCLV
jgi:hypothetical protein